MAITQALPLGPNPRECICGVSRGIVTRYRSAVICAELRAPPDSQGGLPACQTSTLASICNGVTNGAAVCYAAKEPREGTTRVCACDL